MSLTKVTDDVSAVTQLVDANGVVRLTVDTNGDVTIDGDLIAGGGTINYIPDTEKGALNGVATLDGSGKIPSTQLPTSAMEYKGAWDASGGTYPTTPDTGDYWKISVAGTISGTPFLIGDAIIYNGTTWDKIEGNDAIQSVNGQTSSSVVLDSADIGLDATVFGLNTTVQAALVQAESEIDADVAALAAHLADTTDAHDASAISVSPSVAGGSDVQASLSGLATEISNHLADTNDAHDASAISTITTFGATNVQAALTQAETEVGANASAIAAHLADTTDAHDASAISTVTLTNDSAAVSAATTVQEALNRIFNTIARVWVSYVTAATTALTTAPALINIDYDGDGYQDTGILSDTNTGAAYTPLVTGLYRIESELIVASAANTDAIVTSGIYVETAAGVYSLVTGSQRTCQLNDTGDRQVLRCTGIYDVTATGATYPRFVVRANKSAGTVNYLADSGLIITLLGEI